MDAERPAFVRPLRGYHIGSIVENCVTNIEINPTFLWPPYKYFYFLII